MAKITILQPVEKEIKWVKINIPICEEEENQKIFEITNTIPADRICFFVDVDTGKIRHYPGDCAFHLFEKVVDRGYYWLLDDKFQIILSIENDYVPNKLIPGEYGDYVNLNIDDNGVITNWPKYPLFDDFLKNSNDY